MFSKNRRFYFFRDEFVNFYYTLSPFLVAVMCNKRHWKTTAACLLLWGNPVLSFVSLYTKWVQSFLKRYLSVCLQEVQHNCQLHRISFCADDKTDKRIFTFICKDSESNKHLCYVFDSEKCVSTREVLQGSRSLCCWWVCPAVRWEWLIMNSLPFSWGTISHASIVSCNLDVLN